MEFPSEFLTFQALMDNSVDEALSANDPESFTSNVAVGEMTALVFNIFMAIFKEEICHVVFTW